MTSMIGRAEEQHALSAVITAARNGSGGAVTLRGEPGIGKTALLESVSRADSHTLVARCDGYEAESAMPFSGLQRMMAPLAGHLAELPARQQQAFRVAIGAEDGPAPDRFLVGLAALGLLAEASRAQTVVCAIDDVQWLDAESLDVLAFVARRLQAESVAMIFALREDTHRDVEGAKVTESRLAGIPSIRVDGLDLQDAVELLRVTLPTRIEPRAAVQIAEATGRNPLALIDLAQELTASQLSESFLAIEPVSVGRHLEEHYVRIARLAPMPVQHWLLVVAAESTGNPDLILGATAYLGLDGETGSQAEITGLVTVAESVSFRHPLVRSAVYGAASGAERRRAHAALAHVADSLGLDDLRAWHSAESTLGTDLDVADQLERVADRAGRRGGSASRASLLARAAELTPPGPGRAARLVAAGEAANVVGAAHLAHSIFDRIDETELDRLGRGRLIAARQESAAFRGDRAALVTASGQLLAAAAEFHGIAPEREHRALLRAFELVQVTERMAVGVTLDELGASLRLDHESTLPANAEPAAVIRTALSAFILRPYAEAVPLLRAAVHALDTTDDAELLEFGFIGVALTTALWDAGARDAYLRRVARIARDAGALLLLDSVLWVLSLTEIDRGDPRAGGRYVEQVRELRMAIGYEAENVVNGSYLAWTGAPREVIAAVADGMLAGGFAGAETATLTGLSIRDLAEGHYRDAYDRLVPMIERQFIQVTPRQLPEFVEAAERSGHSEVAREAADQLNALAEASGSIWAHGVATRCRALLAPADRAEALYVLAITSLAHLNTPADLGRAYLLYGEWLRRAKRRRDARVNLRLALALFEDIGAESFAQRARSELEATGEHVGDGRPESPFDLTAQEAVIARMAAAGKTNTEIGSALFISTNTVDYHLRKVFRKLQIASRRQLADRFRSAE